MTTKGKLRCLEQRDDDDDYADGWFGKTDYESEKFDISQRWGFRSFGKKAMLVFRESGALLMCLRCGKQNYNQSKRLNVLAKLSQHYF